MASVLRMPGVSADSTEATLLEWSVRPGDPCRRGEPIALIETDKASVELEADEDAVLLCTLAAPEQVVSVGDPIAVLVQPDEQGRGQDAILAELGLVPSLDETAGGTGGSVAATAPGRDDDVPGPVPMPLNGSGLVRVFASPLARRLAAAAGLRVEDIEGTGPGGRVRRRDVEAAAQRNGAVNGAVNGSVNGSATPGSAAAAPAPVPQPVQPVVQPVVQPATPVPVAAAVEGATDVPHSRMRRAIASALTASKQQVPHFYLKASCRVDALLALREQVNADGRVRVSVNDFVVKAAGRALVDEPDMNVVWTPDAVRRFASADVAVAVSSERGLVTPVVRGVERRSLSDLSAQVKDLATRAGAGTLKQADLEGGSLTISNLGMYGVEEFAAIINPPHAGILAVGAGVERPVKGEDGGVEFGRFVTVVLSVDHRPVDGVVAARWLRRFTELVENPLQLLV